MGPSSNLESLEEFLLYVEIFHYLQCMKEGITITDKMAEAIAPKSEDKKTEECTQLLSYLAECCHNQGSYHLACKKYTQSGDRIAAMKVTLSVFWSLDSLSCLGTLFM
jgi:intraflagellar transport protein 140